MAQRPQRSPQTKGTEMTAVSRSGQHMTRIIRRVDALDWTAVNNELDTYGAAAIGPLLTPEQCDELIDAYDDDARYRTRIMMARHGFGRANTNISITPCRQLSRNCEKAYTVTWQRQPIDGTRR